MNHDGVAAGALDVGPLARRIADLALIARGLGDAG
jgi:hypothetical protein